MNAENTEIIIGRKPVMDALQNEVPISSIWIDRTLRGNDEVRIRQTAKKMAIPLKRVSKLVLDKKTKANHQGVLAYTSPVHFNDLENLINHIYSQGKIPFLLYLDRIQDVGNLGSIIRTAEVMGVDGLIIPSQKMAPVNDQVIKISSGALFHLPVCRTNYIKDTLTLLHDLGIRIVASSLTGRIEIQDVDFTGPICIVAGSEDTGISAEIEQAAQELFTIPQHGQTESLNVAVATGIMLYEAMRQRS